MSWDKPIETLVSSLKIFRARKSESLNVSLAVFVHLLLKLVSYSAARYDNKMTQSFHNMHTSSRVFICNNNLHISITYHVRSLTRIQNPIPTESETLKLWGLLPFFPFSPELLPVRFTALYFSPFPQFFVRSPVPAVTSLFGSPQPPSPRPPLLFQPAKN